MNCGKHRRPSIRRPTAARQRYEQSRLSEKAETATQRNFRPAIRRPTAKVGSKTATSRQKRRRSAEKISKYGLPQQKRILPASGTLRRPARENPELCQHFPAKINFSPARNRQSLPPHSRRIQTIKGLRTQPTAGSVPARRKRLLRKPNLRSPPLPATDSPHGGPDRQPHNCYRSHRSQKPPKHVPQAKSSASVPTKENAITAFFLET